MPPSLLFAVIAVNALRLTLSRAVSLTTQMADRYAVYLIVRDFDPNTPPNHDADQAPQFLGFDDAALDLGVVATIDRHQRRQPRLLHAFVFEFKVNSANRDILQQ